MGDQPAEGWLQDTRPYETRESVRGVLPDMFLEMSGGTCSCSIRSRQLWQADRFVLESRHDINSRVSFQTYYRPLAAPDRSGRQPVRDRA